MYKKMRIMKKANRKVRYIILIYAKVNIKFYDLI